MSVYRLMWVWGAVGALVVLAAHPGSAQLSNADKRLLAELALQWAVDGGIPDVKLLKDPSKLVVVDRNLPPRSELHVPKRTVSVQAPIRIQAAADVLGDFLYFQLGPFTGEKGHATVPIALLWAVGIQSKTPYLSGGGATLQFEQRDGKWTLLPTNERWAS